VTALKHAALGLLVVVGSMLLADALGDDLPGTERPSDAVLVSAYPRLHDAAQRADAHAGRDVLAHGRPADGELSWALVRREARRLWRELHPAALSESLPPGWWLNAARPLVACESSGDPHVVSADGRYHGAYQFDEATWRSVGGAGVASSASMHEQHRRAYLLWQQRGWQPWPVCGRLAGGG
jgi:hypothetical protein